MQSQQLKIEFSDQQDKPVETESLSQIAAAILDDHGVTAGELSIALVDDSSIREMNRKYLNHDWETDVISFVLDEDDCSLAGQLIVSTETADRVAKEIGSTMAAELALYVAHGTLHLVGFDDLNEPDALKMRIAEREYLERFSIECTNREA